MKRALFYLIALISLFLLSGCKLWDAINGDGKSNGLPNVNISGGIHQTGQSHSYDANGTRMIQGEIHDDGYYRSGTPPRYKRHDNTVTDALSHLIWEDTPHVNTVSMKQAEAYDYCDGLSLGGYTDWRLPTLNELESLMLFDDDNTTIQHPAFSFVRSDMFWTGTMVFLSNPFGVFIENTGGDIHSENALHPHGPAYVRCVRGSSISGDTFYRENGMVINAQQSINWQDDQEPTKETNWTEAIQYCESLTLAGFDDWRLPNINELLYGYNGAWSHYKFSYKSKGEPLYYWSSTTSLCQCDTTERTITSGSAAYVFLPTSEVESSIGIQPKNNAQDTIIRCIRGGDLHLGD